MLLRITAAVMLIMLSFSVEGSLITSDRYEYKDAEKDLVILKSILSRHPEDLKTLKRLIDLTFTMENFDSTEKYCNQYLSITKNSNAAYLKIISSAALGKFKTAANQIDPFINEYRKELSDRNIFILKYMETLYRKSTLTGEYPSGAAKTAWGEDSLIKAIMPRDNLFAVYNSAANTHNVFRIDKTTSSSIEKYPDYLSGFPAESVNFISQSDDGREILISSSSGDSSSVYIRRYLPDQKIWSSWENPVELNPGKWNHYPNFVNSNTVLFSSSDGLEYDIYISQRDKDGKWSKAEKLSGINTPLDEISIWVHPDGETVYFASNGFEGMGGFDIYGARLIRNEKTFEISGIKNIASANTFRNERYPLFVTPSGDAAFFNFRKGAYQSIFLCREITYKPSPVFFYNADVVDDSTGSPVNGASAEYKSSNSAYTTTRPVYSDGFTGTTLRRDMKCILTISADGYEKFSKPVSFNGKSDLMNDKIRLKKTIDKPVFTGYITLITGIKLIDCEESIALPIRDTLENDIGLHSGDAIKGKNILSFTVCGNTQCALKYARTVKADFAVYGTLVRTRQSAMKTLGSSGEDKYIAQRVTGESYTLELKLLETATGKVIFSYKKTARDSGSLKSITNEFVKRTGKFYIPVP